MLERAHQPPVSRILGHQVLHHVGPGPVHFQPLAVQKFQQGIGALMGPLHFFGNRAVEQQVDDGIWAMNR